MRIPSATVILASILLLGGCASGGSSSRPDITRDPNHITTEELQAQPFGTAYEAVQRLRPNWLRSRSSSLIGGVSGTVTLPRVFVDDREFGNSESLKEIHFDSISEILYLSGRDATTLHGTGYAGGIIHVRLKRIP